MKTRYTFILLTLCVLAACTDEVEYSEKPVEYCIRADWKDGRTHGTRSLSSLMGNGGGNLAVSSEDYPTTIAVTCDGHDFTLTKSSVLYPCTAHLGHFQGYTSSYPLTEKEAKKGATATATIDGADELYCNTSDIVLDGRHLTFNFHHRRSLLRFAFQVDEKYDRVRLIKITDVKLNGNTCPLVEKVLNADGLQVVAYAYIDPTAITVSSSNTLACTYNIYDKDDASTSHLIRESAEASNTFRLSTLKDADNKPVSQIEAGYYYDLNVTLNPDYLGVLSDHDNKHLTIE